MVYHELSCPICEHTILKAVSYRKNSYKRQKWTHAGYWCFRCGSMFHYEKNNLFFSGSLSILSVPESDFIILNNRSGKEIKLINYNYEGYNAI